jgi:hypothetical protein
MFKKHMSELEDERDYHDTLKQKKFHEDSMVDT